LPGAFCAIKDKALSDAATLIDADERLLCAMSGRSSATRVQVLCGHWDVK
jgi:hypothetical protein